MKAHLLPYLEQQQTFNAINFNHHPAWDAGWNGIGPKSFRGRTVNTTAMSTKIEGFLCPSDPNPGHSTDPIGVSNYPENHGTERFFNNWRPNGPALVPSFWDGAVNSKEAYTMRNITDGTSKTAIFSEWVKGTGRGDNRPNMLTNTYTMPTPNNAAFGGANAGDRGMDLMVEECRRRAASASGPDDWIGEYWIWSLSPKGGGYVHTGPPNMPKCRHNDGYAFRPLVNGVIGASSLHSGGVNVCFLDGSVKFVSENVDIKIWRSLGTSAGNEVIDNTAF
jgi:prepilin-type processing-associated H-X9-DG protein